MTESWRVEEVDLAPDVLRPGILYHSRRLGFLQHLCACGCEMMVHVPTTGVGDTWTLAGTPDAPTAGGSFSHRFMCRSHYSIDNGRTVWHMKRGPAC